MTAPAFANALQPPDHTLADLCRGVASELNDLGDLVDDLQPAVSALMAAGGGDLAQYEKLQALDYISQHLKGLGQFLAILSREPQALAGVDAERALGSLSLSNLHGRLRDSSGESRTEPDDDDPSWEMF